MDPIEEQKQEIEILQSIYPDEFHQISDKEFTINIVLTVESQRQHSVKLRIRYPAEYPEVVPELWVSEGDEEEEGEDDGSEEEESDSDDEDQKDTKRALNLVETIELDRQDFGRLAARLQEEAELSVGMPSAFTLASVLKDEAEQRFAEKLKEETRRLEQRREAREKEDQKKFIGTKVSKESFLAWREKFREDMGHNERMKERFNEIHQGKLTGKQIFDQQLAKEEDLGGEMAQLEIQ